MPTVPTVIAMLETVPPDQKGQATDRQTREVSVDAGTYEAGREEIEAGVPDGWRVMWMRVVRPELT